jgi:hypothetical protein
MSRLAALLNNLTGGTTTKYDNMSEVNVGLGAGCARTAQGPISAVCAQRLACTPSAPDERLSRRRTSWMLSTRCDLLDT